VSVADADPIIPLPLARGAQLPENLSIITDKVEYNIMDQIEVAAA